MGKLFDENGKLIDRAALKSVQFGNVYHGGLSHSTGTYVAGVKDMEEQLHRKADEMSERLGFDCDYRLADRNDTTGLGVRSTEEIQEAAYEKQVNAREHLNETGGAETPTSDLIPE